MPLEAVLLVIISTATVGHLATSHPRPTDSATKTCIEQVKADHDFENPQSETLEVEIERECYTTQVTRNASLD